MERDPGCVAIAVAVGRDRRQLRPVARKRRAGVADANGVEDEPLAVGGGIDASACGDERDGRRNDEPWPEGPEPGTERFSSHAPHRRQRRSRAPHERLTRRYSAAAYP